MFVIFFIRKGKKTKKYAIVKTFLCFCNWHWPSYCETGFWEVKYPFLRAYSVVFQPLYQQLRHLKSCGCLRKSWLLLPLDLGWIFRNSSIIGNVRLCRYRGGQGYNFYDLYRHCGVTNVTSAMIIHACEWRGQVDGCSGLFHYIIHVQYQTYVRCTFNPRLCVSIILLGLPTIFTCISS